MIVEIDVRISHAHCSEMRDRCVIFYKMKWGNMEPESRKRKHKSEDEGENGFHLKVKQ